MTRKYLAITALLLAPLAASATTWTLSGSAPSGISSISAFSVAYPTQSTPNPTFSTASWSFYAGNGLGVTSSGESGSPEHAVDNNFRIDALLFRFGANTILDQLTIGWPDDGSLDSDISVLRYTGAVDPVTGALPGDRNISGESISQLLTRGWEFVGSYDVDPNTPEEINPNNLSSSYWLISAYSSSWGTGLGDATGDTYKDYFKLASLTGTTASTTPGVSVPEPTSLLLLAGGMLGWRLNRKNQALAA